MTREVLHRTGKRTSIIKSGIIRSALVCLTAGGLAMPVMAQSASAYPRWSEFPALPQNVPNTTEIRAQVAEIYVQERGLLTQVAAIDWDRHDPDTFSMNTIARLDPELSRPITENIREQANRFAIEQAARAVPPPLID